MSKPLTSLGIFLASSPIASPAVVALAEELGRTCGARGIRVVYGGAKIGTMGRLADAALAAGGEVLGVIPKRIEERELAHRGVTKLVSVQTMAERKAEIFAASEAFAVLPGGFGTLDEAFEVLTDVQLGGSEKPVIFVDPVGVPFWAPLFSFLDGAVAQGVLRAEHRAIPTRVTGIAELLEALGA